MPLPIEPTECATALIDTKRSACERDGGPSDLIPMLQYYGLNGGVVIAALPEGPMVLPAALASITKEHGAPETLVFLSDAHMRVMDKDEMGSVRRGQLAEDFASGDMTVVECLTVSVVTADSARSAFVQYTFDDAGVPQFGEIKVNEGTDGGFVTDCLRAAFV